MTSMHTFAQWHLEHRVSSAGASLIMHICHYLSMHYAIYCYICHYLRAAHEAWLNSRLRLREATEHLGSSLFDIPHASEPGMLPWLQKRVQLPNRSSGVNVTQWHHAQHFGDCSPTFNFIPKSTGRRLRRACHFTSNFDAGSMPLPSIVRSTNQNLASEKSWVVPNQSDQWMWCHAQCAIFLSISSESLIPRSTRRNLPFCIQFWCWMYAFAYNYPTNQPDLQLCTFCVNVSISATACYLSMPGSEFVEEASPGGRPTSSICPW